MNDTINGLLMMILGVLLAILYFVLPPAWFVYAYWTAIAIFLIYGFYMFRKG
jgi:hypothetical protein